MKRIGYAIATVILLLIEVLIAIYVHDAFVRPYIGDVLVVVVIDATEGVTEQDAKIAGIAHEREIGRAHV